MAFCLRNQVDHGTLECNQPPWLSYASIVLVWVHWLVTASGRWAKIVTQKRRARASRQWAYWHRRRRLCAPRRYAWLELKLAAGSLTIGRTSNVPGILWPGGGPRLSERVIWTFRSTNLLVFSGFIEMPSTPGGIWDFVERDLGNQIMMGSQRDLPAPPSFQQISSRMSKLPRCQDVRVVGFQGSRVSDTEATIIPPFAPSPTQGRTAGCVLTRLRVKLEDE